VPPSRTASASASASASISLSSSTLPPAPYNFKASLSIDKPTLNANYPGGSANFTENFSIQIARLLGLYDAERWRRADLNTPDVFREQRDVKTTLLVTEPSGVTTVFWDVYPRDGNVTAHAEAGRRLVYELTLPASAALVATDATRYLVAGTRAAKCVDGQYAYACPNGYANLATNQLNFAVTASTPLSDTTVVDERGAGGNDAAPRDLVLGLAIGAGLIFLAAVAAALYFLHHRRKRERGRRAAKEAELRRIAEMEEATKDVFSLKTWGSTVRLREGRRQDALDARDAAVSPWAASLADQLTEMAPHADVDTDDDWSVAAAAAAAVVKSTSMNAVAPAASTRPLPLMYADQSTTSQMLSAQPLVSSQPMSTARVYAPQLLSTPTRRGWQ
jgi:hypothetical protein